MINNIMDNTEKINPVKSEQKTQEKTKETKPNEKYGLCFSSSLKITDPDSGKIILQMRCD